MSKTRIEVNAKGIRELLKSEGAMNMCMNIADGIAQELGDGYGTNSRMGRNRAIAEIKAETAEAYYSNLKHNTLLKAVKA